MAELGGPQSQYNHVVTFGNFSEEERSKYFGRPQQQLQLPWTLCPTSAISEKDASDVARQIQTPSETVEKPTTQLTASNNGTGAEVQTPDIVAVPTLRDTDIKKPSFADLFKATSERSQVAAAAVNPMSSSTANSSIGNTSIGNTSIGKPHPVAPAAPGLKRCAVAEDRLARKLTKCLEMKHLRSNAKIVEVRGLNNKGNLCYIHAGLQALINLGPLHTLLHQVAACQSSALRPHSCTPVLDAMAEFAGKHQCLATPALSRSNSTDDLTEALPNTQIVNKKRSTPKASPELAIDVIGLPFEPAGMYRVMHLVNPDLSVNGRQEDVSEFVSALLNTLHEEMLSLRQASPQATDSPDQVDSSEWEMVQDGKKNKSVVTRVVKIDRTPVSALFSGEMTSSVSAPDAKASHTVEPFMVLPLDIQCASVKSVEDAFRLSGEVHALDDYKHPKTGEKVKAERRTTISRLPPVMVLQLKRFVYTQSGAQKVDKMVKYSSNLSIPKEILAPSVRSCKVANTPYKLTGVIYHHGKSATAGHYTCDVQHERTGVWLRCDDSKVSIINISQVFHCPKDKTPYLFVYRRC